MAVVIFNVVTFRARFPEFSNVTDTQLQALFDEAAALYLDNTEQSKVQDVVARAALFNLLVAHLAQLNFGSSTQAASPLVGAVTSASEGSVSIGSSAPNVAGSASWFATTKYGYMYWTATAPYRLGRYIPGRSYPLQGRW